MNLLQIKYFHTVCLYKTISAAAEVLYITQPALSNAIKELEKEFGVTLFERRHKGMILTQAGEEFYKKSKEILSHTEQLVLSMRDLGQGRKILKLGIPPMIGSLILPLICKDFCENHSDIDLKITEGGKEELLKKLSDDMLDMVFLPHNAPIEKDLTSMPVAKYEIVCCVNKKSRLSGLKRIQAKDLEKVPLVLFKDSFFQTETIKKWFASSGVQPEILLQTEQLSTVETLISENLAAGFLFRQLIRHNPDFCPVSVKGPMFSDVSLVWKKNAFVTYSMTKFSEFISKNVQLRKGM